MIRTILYSVKMPSYNGNGMIIFTGTYDECEKFYKSKSLYERSHLSIETAKNVIQTHRNIRPKNLYRGEKNFS